MEVQLNEFTKIEVESRITNIHLNNEKKKDVQIMSLRNDKIIGAEVATLKRFVMKRFYIVLLLAVLAGAAHYLYDTQFLGYVPNPPLIAGLFSIVLLVGLFFCFGKKKYFSILVVAEERKGRLNKPRYEFLLGSDVEDKKIQDLLYLLAV